MLSAFKGTIQKRTTGSLISYETGESVTYGCTMHRNAAHCSSALGFRYTKGWSSAVSETGRYGRQHLQTQTADQYPCIGSDDALRLIPPKVMSLEQCLEFISDDELLEVTPHNLRIRKQIWTTRCVRKQTQEKRLMNQYPPGYQNPAGIFTKTDRCFVMERFLCDEVWQAKQPNRRKSIRTVSILSIRA